jgi:acetyl esterase
LLDDGAIFKALLLTTGYNENHLRSVLGAYMPLNAAEVKFFQFLEEERKKAPPKPLSELTLSELRGSVASLLAFAGSEANIPKKEQAIPIRDGRSVKIRIYNSELADSPVLIFYPGCGYILPAFELNAIAASRIAKAANIKVIVPDFDLAPENALPKPIFDCYDVTKYIYNHCDELKIDSKKFFIGGLSSGAHCAASISILARTDSALKITGQILINGCYDFTRSLREFSAYETEDRLLTQDMILYQFSQNKLTDDQARNPLLSPYFEENLAGLPSTIIIVAEYDAVRSDSEAFYSKLVAAGNKVKKILMPGQSHNTMILRSALSDGEDPSVVAASVLLEFIISCSTASRKNNLNKNTSRSL